jgi:hypothetical protein
MCCFNLIICIIAKNIFITNFIIAIRKKLEMKILMKDNLSKQANSGYNLWTFILSDVLSLTNSKGL